MSTAITKDEMKVMFRGLVDQGMDMKQAMHQMLLKFHPDRGGNKDNFVLFTSKDVQRHLVPQMVVAKRPTYVPTAVTMKEIHVGMFRHEGKRQICIAWVGYTDFRPMDTLVNKGTVFVPHWETVKITKPTLIRVEKGSSDEVVLCMGNHRISNSSWYDEETEDIKIPIRLNGSFDMQYLNPKQYPGDTDRKRYNHVAMGDAIQIPVLLSAVQEQMALQGASAINIVSAIPTMTLLRDQNAKDTILVIDGNYGGSTLNGFHKITVTGDNKLLPTGSDILIPNAKFESVCMHWMIVTREFRDVAGKQVFANGATRIQREFKMPKKVAKKQGTSKKKHTRVETQQDVTSSRKKVCLKQSYLFEVVATPCGEGYMNPSEDAHKCNSKLCPMIQHRRLELTVKQAEAVLCFARSMTAWNDKGDVASNELTVAKEYDIIVYRETRDHDLDFKIASPTIVTEKFPKRTVPNTEFYRRIRAVYIGLV